jgi:hypothetical protein
MAIYLNFEQTLNALINLGDKRTILVQGENGIGKTALFHAMKRHPKFINHIAVDPIDCTQLSDGSVWMPDIDREHGVSRELPNERFGLSHTNQKGVNGARPILVFFDEIAKARQYIKDTIAPIIYEHRLGAYHAPDGSTIFAATNLAIEGLGDSIQAHLRNRLVVIKMRKPTMEEWVKWAYANGIHEYIIAFCMEYPMVFDSFIDYEQGGKFEGRNLSKDNGHIFNPKIQQDAYASPRSLHAASDILHKCLNVVDDDTLEALLTGAVGEVTSKSIGSFVRFGHQVTPFERVLHDPANAPLTDNAGVQLVQVLQFINRTKSREEADKVLVYVNRMKEEMQSVFCTQLANSADSTPSALHFGTNKKFADLLAKHRIYFGTK